MALKFNSSLTTCEIARPSSDWQKVAHPIASGYITGQWMIFLLGCSVFILALLMRSTHLSINIHSPKIMLLGGLFTALAIGYYGLRNANAGPRLIARDLIEYIGLFAFIAILGATSSYPVAALSTGFHDAFLEYCDRALGFDWIALYHIVVTHPILQYAGRAAYLCIYISPLILMSCFAFTGRKADARRFLMTFWLGAVITIALFILMPANGALAALWHGPIPYMPAAALDQSQIIPLLRAHVMQQINLADLRGLVCAPSFHTTSAVLYMTAGWPVARLRWPIMLMNLCMLMSTPIEGTHYLTDMIAGALVAGLALLIVAKALRHIPHITR